MEIFRCILCFPCEFTKKSISYSFFYYCYFCPCFSVVHLIFLSQKKSNFTQLQILKMVIFISRSENSPLFRDIDTRRCKLQLLFYHLLADKSIIAKNKNSFRLHYLKLMLLTKITIFLMKTKVGFPKLRV